MALATATSVHDQLLKYIRLAWAAEDSQDLRDAYPQSVVIDAVVQMGDSLYAQYLETIQTWEPEHFLDYITNTIHTQPLEKSQALIARWMHLLLYLIFNDKIEREHGDELLAMFARGAQFYPSQNQKAELSRYLTINGASGKVKSVVKSVNQQLPKLTHIFYLSNLTSP
ncbi:hypothetical protein DB330_05365 [Lacticaseibacillus casei]|uniref:Uncharacterized protein n=1 Tax=Lacticaseibacillus casei DSM 20011 = JCM 1134 = ATCC 393 TaxID=1423732 RepID=A0AAD1ASB8_LACCA|nr:hypothetical protein [Lacticaseibacillus casei]MBI6597394.1 hypothetical protein [Lacticaseibacillus casei]MBO2416369.1 hypothetical protein [Lacticaseibacillus casei]MCK2080814.1 hypothetical protein [Lacticaseibacillus casei]MED7630311.1 hypothetical protein [Lacticaseibacillus casei]PTU96973.1 hypothetical protein DB330_05365 [Lacticaseibacillus casei]